MLNGGRFSVQQTLFVSLCVSLGQIIFRVTLMATRVHGAALKYVLTWNCCSYLDKLTQYRKDRFILIPVDG